MSTHRRTSCGPHLGAFDTDSTIIQTKNQLGYDPGVGHRFEFISPNGQRIIPTKVIKNRKDARSFNDWLHGRKSAPVRVPVAQQQPLPTVFGYGDITVDDVIFCAKGQWYFIGGTGAPYTINKPNSYDGAVRYANTCVSNGTAWTIDVHARKAELMKVLAK